MSKQGQHFYAHAEIFKRIYYYVDNFGKDEPLTYRGMKFLPIAGEMFRITTYDPLHWAITVLFINGLVTDVNEFVKIVNYLNDDEELTPKEKFELTIQIKKCINEAKKLLKESSFLEFLKEFTEIAIAESNLTEKSPTNVPNFVTDYYFPDASPEYLKELNRYLHKNPASITPYLAFAIDSTVRALIGGREKAKRTYENLTPNQIREAKKMGVLNDEMVNYIDDPEFTNKVKTSTIEDLQYMKKMSTGCTNDFVSEIPSPNVNQTNIERSHLRFPIERKNTKNAIVQSLKDIEDAKQIEYDTCSNDGALRKVLLGGAGIALTTGAAYALYKWWKHRQEQNAQKSESKVDDQNPNPKSKSKPKPTRNYINIVTTGGQNQRPMDEVLDLEF